MSVQQTEELTEVVTIIARAAGPFVEKETSQDTAASVTVQMSEHSPLYTICPGHLPKDTAIIALRWVDSRLKVQDVSCLGIHNTAWLKSL